MIRNGETISTNRRAKFDYAIEDKMEVGIALTGTEVKSLRNARARIDDSYVGEGANGNICIFNMNIPEYKFANQFNHLPKRVRTILVHKRERGKLLGKVRVAGYSIIPLSLYFNDRGFIKMCIALAKGKRNIDKRESIKEREWNRQKSRILKDLNT